MNIAQAFRSIFQRPGWVQKTISAALLLLIPVAGPLVLMGWTLEISRRVIAGEDDRLPVVNIRRDFNTGFQAFLLGLIYTIPVFILVAPVWLAPFFGDFFSLETADILNSVINFSSAASVALYGCLLTFLLPAVYANFLVKQDINAGLHLGEILAILKASPAGYLYMVPVTIAGSFGAVLGIFICLVGVMITQVLFAALLGSLWGQAFLQSENRKDTKVKTISVPA